MFYQKASCLIREYDGEVLRIEPWGKNALRVRAGFPPFTQSEDYALLPPAEQTPQIRIEADHATIRNGDILAHITADGRLEFRNGSGKLLLKEYVRTRDDTTQFCSALGIPGRQYKPIIGGDHSLTVRFESDPKEKLSGLDYFTMKNLDEQTDDAGSGENE
jgi:alpha-D-xyloside xylohydrolase